MMLFAVLFLVTPLQAETISFTEKALIVIRPAHAVAEAVGATPRAALICVAVTAASFLTAVGSGANMMVKGPTGYRFRKDWRLGLSLLLWFSWLPCCWSLSSRILEVAIVQAATVMRGDRP